VKTHDLILFCAFVVAVISSLSLTVWKRWSARQLVMLLGIAAFVIIGYTILLRNILELIMLPTRLWWDLEENYRVVFIEPLPFVSTVLGVLAVLALYVLIASRFFGNQRLPGTKARLYAAVQVVFFLLGGFISTFVYPALVAAASIPNEESRTSGVSLLTYSQSLHTAVLTFGIVFCLLVTILQSRLHRNSRENPGRATRIPNSPDAGKNPGPTPDYS
jgi:hypothetical protein